MFELHIEQGPILEDEGRMIGIVQGVQGMRWYEVTVTGQEAHTGATPMRLRKNALLGAARMIDRIDAIARDHAPDAVGTVGLIENQPNSRNVIPGEVFFTVDFRHPDDKRARRHGGEIPRRARRDHWRRCKLAYSETRIWDSPAVKFAPELIDCVRIGAEKAGFTSRDMISGAGHDAAYIARVAPTTMIFVPCRRRHLPQRSGIRQASTNAPPARRCCSMRCWSMIGGWGERRTCQKPLRRSAIVRTACYNKVRHAAVLA